MRAVRVLLLLTFVGPFACHRPLAVPDPVPRYPVRPLKTDAELERILKEYGTDVIPAEDTGGQHLKPSDVLRLAAANHPGVLSAQAQVVEARARMQTAGAWPNPELEGRLLVDTDGRLEGEGAFMFTLPLGGRIGAAEEQAAVDLDLARLALVKFRREALLQAERLLARLAHARARLALFENLAKRSRQYASLARSRRSASMADPLDVALVLADAAGDRRAVARARATVSTAERELRLILGLAPGQAGFEIPPAIRLKLSESASDLQKAALAHRPDLLQARLRVVLTDREAARAAAERLPDLHLGPAVNIRSGESAVGLMLAIPLPLFNTGAGPYREALARREGALAAYRQAIRETVSRVAEELNRLQAGQAELDELIGEVSGAVEGALELAEVRYSAGKLDVLRLLSIHRAFADLKLEYLDLLLAQREVLIDLHQAVGRPVKTKEVVP